eukprot:TRINITY_DN2861_c0_g1_i4.p1 TRINITY_DN2861_c0_g1~~TRINITY_DN2861_c0_g1_i4.p1  ORF type:complete len:315 (-),score=49.97 TRINITY_DN2861_c0_g1_i4:12-956(-)
MSLPPLILSNHTKQIMLFIFPSISLLSSFFIVVTYGRFRQHAMKKGNSFVFFLSVCDMFYSLMFIATATISLYMDPFDGTKPVDMSNICFWIGVWSDVTSVSTTSWNMMISMRVFMSLRNRTNHHSSTSSSSSSPSSTRSQNWPYHLYVWLFTIIHCAVLMYLDAFGPSYGGCWIVDKIKFRLFWLVPLGSYLLLSTLILAYVLYYIHKVRRLIVPHQEKFDKKEADFRRQLVKYSVVFVVMWSIPFAARVSEAAGYQSDIFIILDIICTTMQAFANSIVWASSPNFLEYWRRARYTQNSHDRETEALINQTPY